MFYIHSSCCSCFPHVVNISSQHGLKALCGDEPDVSVIAPPVMAPYQPHVSDPMLPTAAADVDLNPSSNPELIADMAYANALEGDVIAAARTLVAKCRASGQRRERFSKIIAEGNKADNWPKSQDGVSVRIDDLQLLRDVDTRWSSVFLMIDRLLYLYPVSSRRSLGSPHQPRALHILLRACY